jgi:hypothetical protein
VRLLVTGTERSFACLLALVLLEDGHDVVAEGGYLWKEEPQ